MTNVRTAWKLLLAVMVLTPLVAVGKLLVSPSREDDQKRQEYDDARAAFERTLRSNQAALAEFEERQDEWCAGMTDYDQNDWSLSGAKSAERLKSGGLLRVTGRLEDTPSAVLIHATQHTFACDKQDGGLSVEGPATSRTACGYVVPDGRDGVYSLRRCRVLKLEVDGSAPGEARP